MTREDDMAAAARRVAALRTALEARQGSAVRLVETHISWVLLGESTAWKLKKPVTLPFLDFGTLAERRRCCEEELRLNRRLAPTLYLDVAEVREGPDGPRFGGEGEVVDAAVRMRRFPDGALWSERVAAGTLTARDVDAMARRLADFHRAAPAAGAGTGHGTAAAHERVVRRLFDGGEAGAEGGGAPASCRRLLRQIGELAPLWDARRRAGRVRECHGDLHLANVLQLDGEPAAFDALEFDDELRWIDVLDEAAFLAMDLMAHGERALAFRFLDAYLQHGGDHDGVPALRFFLVCRALVRAQVAALGPAGGAPPARPGTDDYRSLAADLDGGADPRLAITHGLPGSGKSHAAQALLEHAGALRLRSDVERKRLFGLGPLDPSREAACADIYDAAATRRTFDRLEALARTALRAGWPVIVDAAFLRRAERARFAALAASLGVPFAIVDCRAPLPLLHERLVQRQARGDDPSEADGEVLERLRCHDEPLDASEEAVALVVDAERPEPPAAVARHWQAAGRP